MRRSAAPSFRSSAKRPRFLSQLLNSKQETDKENDLLNYMDPEVAEEFNLLTSFETEQSNCKSIEKSEVDDKNSLRSSDDILKLLFEDAENGNSDAQQPVQTSHQTRTDCLKSTPSYNAPGKTASISEIECDQEETNLSSSESNDSVSYSVLYCKRSAKKHKIWEGDGILIVRNRSAILKNSEGKEIDRGLGYKFKDISSLEEGSKFCVGSKECEVQNVISTEKYIPEKMTENSVTLSLPSKFQHKIKKSPSCM